MTTICYNVLQLDDLYKSASLTLTSRVHEVVSGMHEPVNNGRGHVTSKTASEVPEVKETTESHTNKRKASTLIDQLVTE